jgi:hypothetical protein
MDRDQQILVILISFPLLLALFLCAAVFVIRRQVATTCPKCGARVPRASAASVRMECPHCSVAQLPPPIRDGETCRACQTVLDENRGLRLWDGYSYCRKCVAARSENLVRAASGTDRFQETTVSSPWRAARNSFLVLLVVCNIPFGTFAFLGAGWQGLLGLQLLLGPLCLVFAAAHAIGYSLRRPITEVYEGRLRVWSGTSSLADYALTDCQWFRGAAFYINPFIGDTGILILLPRDTWKPQGYAFLGGTPETRDLWEAFFTLAGIKRREDLEYYAGRRALWLTWIVGALALPVCFGAGILLATAAATVLTAITGDQQLAALISFPLFVPGCIYMLLYLAFFTQQGKTPMFAFSALEQRVSYWRMLLPLLLVNGMITFGVLSFRNVPWHARVAGAISNVTLALLVCHDLATRGSRLGTQKW